jgi:RNA polymerase sigma-70 factor (ECF subfamily)
VIDDREICRRIAEGDPDTFNAVYRENAARLCAFVKQMTQDLSAAQDIVQETFTQLWKKPGGFRPECGSIRSYLFGMARKKTSEWWRTHRSAEPLGGDEVHAGNLELGSLLQEAMTKLTEEQRLLLWLREIEGQSYAELAAILEIPMGTVRSRLFAAREALRQVWLSAPGRKEGPHDVRSRRGICLGPM